MGRSSSFPAWIPSSSLLLLLLLSLCFHRARADILSPPRRVVSPAKPLLQFLTEPPISDIIHERIHLTASSRTKILSYANRRRATLRIEGEGEGVDTEVAVCLHRNDSSGLSQCDQNEWGRVENKLWSINLSPYEECYIDIILEGKSSSNFTVLIEEELERWRLVFFGVGFLFLLHASTVGRLAELYCSDTNAWVVLVFAGIFIFQALKFFPEERRRKIYLVIFSFVACGSVSAYFWRAIWSLLPLAFKLGSPLTGMQFTRFINGFIGRSSNNLTSIVAFLALLALVLGGLVYYLRRVWAGSAFTNAAIGKLAMLAVHVTALVLIVQSSHDLLLALAAWAISWFICRYIAL